MALPLGSPIMLVPTARQCNGVMPKALQPRQSQQRHKMPDVQAVGGSIKPVIDGYFLPLQQVFHTFKTVVNQTAPLQFCQMHLSPYPILYHRVKFSPLPGLPTPDCNIKDCVLLYFVKIGADLLPATHAKTTIGICGKPRFFLSSGRNLLYD
jgi:hypothetical protein